MGIKLERKKKRVFLLTFIYRLSKFPFASKRRKLKLFLDLEWVFDRLSLEYSYKVFSADEHPARIITKKFLLQFIRAEDTVLDLGCNAGYITDMIAEKAKYVVGVDHSESLIEIAKKGVKRNNVEFHCGEAYEFLLSNKKQFDVLILSHILEHLDTPSDFINKFKMFFNYIYIEVPDFDKSYLNHYRKKMGLSLIYSDGDHINEFDRNDLRQLLAGCNIEIVQAEYIYGLQRLWCRVKK